MLAMLADAQRRVGQRSDAQTSLAGAMALASQLGERNWEAEMPARSATPATRPTRAELVPAYAKFTQGFGTPLLVEAKVLLDELGGA
jgi:hypothetical protein